MFASIVDLVVGQGDADTLLSRIQSDLLPIYRAAQGFVAYYAVKQSENSVTTIRIFEDQASIEAAHQNAEAATQQIKNDLQLESTVHTGAEATVASAFGAIHVP